MTELGRPLLPPDKELFSIGEACRVLQIPRHTLRYWEKRFGLFRPIRRESGHRRYTRRDLETALQIKDLVRNKRLTIAGASRALAAARRGGRSSGEGASGPTPTAVLKLLRDIREDLQKLIGELSR